MIGLRPHPDCLMPHMGSCIHCHVGADGCASPAMVAASRAVARAEVAGQRPVGCPNCQKFADAYQSVQDELDMKRQHLTDFQVETLARLMRERDEALSEVTRLIEAPFACDTHACGHCKGCRAAGIRDLFTEYSNTISQVRSLAKSWAESPTDYDEDTEQQIEDGRAILAILDGRGVDG